MSLNSTEKTMTQMETSSPKLQWGDMVDDDDDDFENEFGGVDNYTYIDLKKDEDEKPLTPPRSDIKQSAKKEPQVSAPPPEYDQEQIYYLTNQLHIMKDRLQKNSLFLSQERDKRATAENYANYYYQKFREVETILVNEQQFRLASENQLSQCKGIIADLQQSRKMSEADSDELNKLRKELQEKTIYIHEQASKLRAQEEMTKSLEWKVAELTEKVPQLATVSKIDAVTQTEDFAFNQVSKPKDHMDTEKLSAQSGASEPEGVSEVEGTNETKLVSKPEEASQQEIKNNRRRRELKKEKLERPVTKSQCKVIKEMPQLQEVISRKGLLIPYLTVEKEVPQAEEVFASEKKQRRKRRRKKSITKSESKITTL